MSDTFPMFETTSPAPLVFGADLPPPASTGPEPKKRGPRRGTVALEAQFTAEGKGGEGAFFASPDAPAKRRGRPAKVEGAAPLQQTDTPLLLGLLPHLVGLQEAHIGPLTKAYRLLAELSPRDRRQVSAILAKAFA